MQDRSLKAEPLNFKVIVFLSMHMNVFIHPPIHLLMSMCLCICVCVVCVNVYGMHVLGVVVQEPKED